MSETGMGRGEHNRREAIERAARELDSEQDLDKLDRLVRRHRAVGTGSWLTDAPEVQAALRRAEDRLKA